MLDLVVVVLNLETLLRCNRLLLFDSTLTDVLILVFDSCDAMPSSKDP